MKVAFQPGENQMSMKTPQKQPAAPANKAPEKKPQAPAAPQKPATKK
ncbi:MAG TPA: hypothetical protein VLF94_01560 [Chlamydiales bacterium]|nr:hypothetical protein [Chlamydiales bacterium]